MTTLATIEAPQAPYARQQPDGDQTSETGYGHVSTVMGTYRNSEHVLISERLNWEVETRLLHLADGTLIPNFVGVVRADTDKVLGVRSPEYKAIQNRDAFAFLDSLHEDGLLDYSGAGTFKGGSNVWIQARLREDMRIGDDTYAQFLIAVTSHNGDRSLSVYASNLNLWCTNQLSRVATQAEARVYIRHNGNLEAKMNKAREAFRITTAEHRRMQEFLSKTLKVQVSEPAFTSVREKLFGALDDATPTQRRNAIDAFTEIYRVETERHGETAYSLVNTITGYADHKIRITKVGDRMSSELSGRIATFKQQGIAEVHKIAARA